VAKLTETSIQKILILGAVAYFVVLLVVFATLYFLQQVPSDRLLPILGTVALVSIASVLIGFLFLGKTARLTETANRLLRGLKELETTRAILVTNQDLKTYYESEAKKIRIISPDLYDDFDIFYETILTNVKSDKAYEYIIPKRAEVISRMQELLEKLQHDLGVTDKKKVPVRYVSLDFPIVTEYVLYKIPAGKKELDGFVEVRLGPTERDTTNIALDDDEKHQLNELFNKLFPTAHRED